MKRIWTKHIPFPPFEAMAIWPFIFLRKGCNIDAKDIQHEEIHGQQQKEMLIVFFYVFYGLCWLKELVHCAIDKQRGQADLTIYKPRKYLMRVEHSIILEREAYTAQCIKDYLSVRAPYSWIHF